MKPIKKVWLNVVQLFALILITASSSAQLTANFSADQLSGCPPMVVNFKDLSTGSPVSWKWDLGNGTISFLQNPTVAYFNPGSYTIKLVVKNATGADSLVKTQYINVNALPVPNFGASQTTGCFPLPVQFSDSSLAGSGTIATWQWDFGDGTLSSLQNPSHTYTGPGNFSVTLQVKNSNGCIKAFTRPAYITLQTGVRADFSYVSAPGCNPPTSGRFFFEDNSGKAYK